MRKKKNRCRDDWYAHDDEVACGFKYENGERVFDSQVNSQLFCEVFTPPHCRAFAAGARLEAPRFTEARTLAVKLMEWE